MENATTRYGQSDLGTIPANGTVQVGDSSFVNPVAIPVSLPVTGLGLPLSAAGQQVQLSAVLLITPRRAPGSCSLRLAAFAPHAIDRVRLGPGARKRRHCPRTGRAALPSPARRPSAARGSSAASAGKHATAEPPR